MVREQEILNGVVKVLVELLSPKKIILFGSRAKGTYSPFADFDFAVDAAKPEIGIRTQLNDAIEKIAGLYSIDVVYLDAVENDFKDIILSSGTIVYGR